jgi:hypothetical protein
MKLSDWNKAMGNLLAWTAWVWDLQMGSSRSKFVECAEVKTVYLWYVQNVSTFPNTFTIVSPLICVFWIQLTRTNAVFSRIALVTCFCAEIQLSGKILENIVKILFYQKTHGARRGDGERLGARLTTRGTAQAWPRPPVVRPPRPSPWHLFPPTYTLWPERSGGFGVFSR